MNLITSRRGLLALAAVIPLGACASGWSTQYTPDPKAAKEFHVTKINVDVPRTLTVSENEFVFVPKADILWREEPEGDRYAQVQKIFEEGAAQGVSGMKGKTAAVLNITVKKFHAINNKTLNYSPTGTGVFDIAFDAELVDAKTGKVLVAKQPITADFLAKTGQAARDDLAKGITQRKLNVAQIGRTIAGWLGNGPTNLTDFKAIGG